MKKLSGLIGILVILSIVAFSSQLEKRAANDAAAERSIIEDRIFYNKKSFGPRKSGKRNTILWSTQEADDFDCLEALKYIYQDVKEKNIDAGIAKIFANTVQMNYDVSKDCFEAAAQIAAGKDKIDAFESSTPTRRFVRSAEGGTIQEKCSCVKTGDNKEQCTCTQESAPTKTKVMPEAKVDSKTEVKETEAAEEAIEAKGAKSAVKAITETKAAEKAIEAKETKPAEKAIEAKATKAAEKAVEAKETKAATKAEFVTNAPARRTRAPALTKPLKHRSNRLWMTNKALTTAEGNCRCKMRGGKRNFCYCQRRVKGCGCRGFGYKKVFCICQEGFDKVKTPEQKFEEKFPKSAYSRQLPRMQKYLETTKDDNDKYHALMTLYGGHLVTISTSMYPPMDTITYLQDNWDWDMNDLPAPVCVYAELTEHSAAGVKQWFEEKWKHTSDENRPFDRPICFKP